MSFMAKLGGYTPGVNLKCALVNCPRRVTKVTTFDVPDVGLCQIAVCPAHLDTWLHQNTTGMETR